jgi:crotonobetainyl-CoA:carnitine CoA-transferase CaiB-like acyl-CoA transferase
MEDSALEGVRVLEIGGGIPAAFPARLLAGYGADVVRVEGPDGALTEDEVVYLLPGKRRVAPDAAGLRALALAADILIEDGTPGSLAASGLDPQSLLREKPSLVIVSVTPFGQTGPHAAWAATNIVSFAAGGLMSITGSPQRTPLVNGGSQAHYLGGMNAFGAALSGYYGALISGEGDWVDISIQECIAGMLELQGPGSAYDGLVRPRSGNHVRASWGIYPCADGYAGVCALERQIPALFSLVGIPEDAVQFRDRDQRPLHDDELQAIMYGWFAAHTKREIVESSPKYRVPLGAVLTPKDLLASENLAQRGFFDDVQLEGATARVPGRPFEGMPWRDTWRLHASGEDTAAVTADWLGGAR